MKKRTKVLLLSIFFIAEISLPVIAQLKVLVINSYHRGYTWSDVEIDGISDVLKFHKSHMEMFVENMDTKRYDDGLNGPYTRNFYSRMINKYSNKKIDGIITVDDAALRFMFKYGDEIFGNAVPVVAIGVNVPPVKELEKRKNYLAAVEAGEHVGTIDLALRLQPKAKTIYVITGRSFNGKEHKKKIEELAERYKGRVEFIFLDDKKTITYNDIKEKVKKIPAGQIVYNRGFYMDSGGNAVNAERMQKEIPELSKSPVYTSDDIYLGLGPVGGKLKSAYKHGTYGAETLVEILHGAPVDKFPKYTVLEPRYMVDYNVIKKYGLKLRALPAGTEIINRTQSFFEKYLVQFLVIIILLFAEGIIIFFLVINILRRREAQRMLKSHAEELARTSEDLEYFTYASSHDIKEPLRQVNLFLEKYESKNRDKFDETDRESIDYMKKGINQMIIIQKGIVEYLKASKREKKEKIELYKAAENAINSIAPMIEQSGASVVNETCRDVHVYANRENIEFVFRNLTENGIKFRKNNMAEIKIGCMVKEKEVLCYVEDNGIGIDEKYAEKVFKPFENLNPRDDYGGTGLGLAICKRIVERYGGRIWFESEEGKGTVFYFTFIAENTGT